MTTVKEYHQSKKEVIPEKHSLLYIYNKLQIVRKLLETQKHNELVINECINVLNDIIFEVGEYNYITPPSEN